MLTFILVAFLLSGAPRARGPQAVYLRDGADRPIPAAIVAEFLDEEAVRAAGGSRERAAAKLAREMFAERIDLDGDGRHDWVIRYGCAAVGNCGTWVYRTTRGGFKEVLDADNVQTVRTLRSSSKGLRDLEARSHGSAFDGELFVYRFDGRKYRRVACMTYGYRYLDARGYAHNLKRPRLVREKCEADEEQ